MKPLTHPAKNQLFPFAPSRPRVNMVLIPILLCLAALPLRAATWNNASTTSQAWATGTNWQGGTAPNGTDAVATFDNTVAGGNKGVTVTSATIGMLNIQGAGTAAAGSITGGTLTFKSSSGDSFIKYQGTNVFTISSILSLANGLTIQAGIDPQAPTYTTKLTLSGAIQGNGYNITVNAGNGMSTTTLSGVISGVGTRILKSGGGTLVLSNSNNTFSGGLDITAGNVVSTFANAMGAGTVIGGGVVSGQNYLGTGDIRIANPDVSLTINSTGASIYYFHTDFNGGNVLLENGGSLILQEAYYSNK